MRGSLGFPVDCSAVSLRCLNCWDYIAPNARRQNRTQPGHRQLTHTLGNNSDSDCLRLEDSRGSRDESTRGSSEEDKPVLPSGKTPHDINRVIV